MDQVTNLGVGDAQILERSSDYDVLSSRAEIVALRVVHPGRAKKVIRRPVGGAIKRGFDIAVSLVGLLLLSPLLTIVAIAIALESRGPVFFLQRRGGLFGRTFLIYKFRTMSVVDDGKTIEQAQRDDPRLTRLGATLRALSIDELPQLFNVFRGEMSLVGPRPHATAHDKKFLEIDPLYRHRWRARPGITGIAQVSGSRGLTADAASVKRRVELDLKYVRKWSIWLDVWILIRTVFLVVHDPRAH